MRTWGDLFKELWANPMVFAQQHLLMIVMILLLIFLLSRVNNILEIRGVDKAIMLSRGIVSTFTAFIVTPIAFILLINIIAALNNLPTIDVSRIWDWIKLTLTSYWWLARCAFNSADIGVMSDVYDGNSIIRILWITIPISFVWLRTVETNLWRIMLLPLIIGILFVTRHRVAEDTFLTPHLKPHFQAWFTDKQAISARDKDGVRRMTENDFKIKPIGLRSPTGDFTDFYSRYSNKVTLFLVFLFAGAIAIGYMLKKPGIGAILALAAILIFFLLDQGRSFRWHKSGMTAAERQLELDTLYTRFLDAAYMEDALMQSELAIEINKRLEADGEVPPDSLCEKYRTYFYDACKRR